MQTCPQYALLMPAGRGLSHHQGELALQRDHHPGRLIPLLLGISQIHTPPRVQVPPAAAAAAAAPARPRSLSSLPLHLQQLAVMTQPPTAAYDGPPSG
eukprot:1145425-Pelagomonas_calceolata.AAC.7